MTSEVPPDDEVTLGPPGDPESVARTICLRLLDRRARTRAELADELRRKGVPDGAAGLVLDRFTDVGLIDDDALAASYALAQHRERGLAGRAVAAKLRRRGVDEQTVASALEPIDRGSEYAAAEALVRNKLRSLGGLDSLVQARRLTGLLGRRGYSPGLAHELVRAVLAETAADVDRLDGSTALT
ncbi:MAG: regulatory protein RecX [Jatrophihabitantaceae bacterium]